MRQHVSAADEELHVENVDVEAKPPRGLPVPGMQDAAKEKRARQLAFMLTMHTQERALQMITKLSGPTKGFEICRRFLEEWEPAHRDRYRAMLMQSLLVRQYEAQSGDTPHDKIKASVDTQFTRPRVAQARRTGRDEAARVICSLSGLECSAPDLHAVGMADGTQATPMEVDASKSKEEGKAKEKGKGKNTDKSKE